MPETARAILRVSGLEVRHGALQALRGVSLDVPEGAIVALLGANGAGKTTLLRALSGVLAPDAGSILYRGVQIAGWAPERVVRAGISHVPEGRELFPLLGVRENLMMGAYTRRDAAGIAADLERICGIFPVLGERARQPAGCLSGGEQQMLAIGRALMARPRLLLMDEPSLGLAPRLTRALFETVARICREEGLSVLVAEQNARVALAHSAWTCVLELGRVAAYASSARLLGEDFLREFHLGDTLGARRDPAHAPNGPRPTTEEHGT